MIILAKSLINHQIDALTYYTHIPLGFILPSSRLFVVVAVVVAAELFGCLRFSFAVTSFSLLIFAPIHIRPLCGPLAHHFYYFFYLLGAPLTYIPFVGVASSTLLGFRHLFYATCVCVCVYG
jgi:hypothetical protein